MTNPDEDLLVTTEGVDEGSAKSTAEGSGPASDPASGPASAAVVGAAGPAGEQSEATPAPPVDAGTDEPSSGPGQQLAAGEG